MKYPEECPAFKVLEDCSAEPWVGDVVVGVGECDARRPCDGGCIRAINPFGNKGGGTPSDHAWHYHAEALLPLTPAAEEMLAAAIQHGLALTAVAEEREACARIAETYRRLWGSTVEGSQDPGPTIAAAIRARRE